MAESRPREQFNAQGLASATHIRFARYVIPPGAYLQALTLGHEILNACSILCHRLSPDLFLNEVYSPTAPRRRTRYARRWRLHCAALFAIALVLQSCSTKQAIPDFDKALDGFGAGRPEDKPQPVAMEANIFINLAQSMRGFAIVAGSNYRRVLESVLAETSAQQYTVQKFRFSTTVSAADGYTAAHFLDPSNYTSPPASLSQLLDQVVRQRQYERLNIIVSDLVDSGGASGQPSVSAALRELASKGVQVMLLGFRSGYQGDYRASAISCASRPIPMRANQSLPGSGRPFYILVIAPNSASLARFNRAVLEKLRPQVSFSPSGNPLLLESGGLVSQPKISILDKTRRRKDYNATRRFYSSFAIPSGRDEVKLLFRWAATKVFDVEPSKLSFEVTSERLEKSGKFVPSTGDQMQVKASDDSKNGSGEFFFEYSLHPPETSSFVVFRVQMRGGVGNVQLPRWIKDWSAEDDCAAASANRTYHLNLVGDSLMSNFAQDAVFAEHYIAIREK